MKHASRTTKMFIRSLLLQLVFRRTAIRSMFIVCLLVIASVLTVLVIASVLTASPTAAAGGGGGRVIAS